jgi:hypothetical protein
MMKRPLATIAIATLCSTSVWADVTITTVTTIEGGLSAMTGGATPRTVTRIKGSKARSDVDAMGQTFSSLVDLTTKQVLFLHPAEKTAQVMGAGSGQAPGPSAGLLTKLESALNVTGRSQDIDGIKCQEYTFAITVALSEMSSQMSPQAAEMLKDTTMRLNGSVWAAKDAPGAAEYIAFQKAAANADLFSALTGGLTGMPTQGIDRVMRSMSGAQGIPYLTEMNMTVEGSGPAADMMKQMGTMKISNKVTALSTDAIPDETFVVPSDYKLIKP